MNTEINDKLDLLIAFSANDCGKDDVEMFRNLDTSGVILSDDFYVRQRRLINRYKRKPTLTLFRKCLVRVAVALMAIMSIGFLTAMAIPNVRNAIFDAVVEWYENYISVRFEPNYGENTDKTDTSSVIPGTDNHESSDIAITPPTKIEKVMKPMYVPNGVEEDIVANNKTVAIIDYYLGDDLILSFTQTLYNNRDMLYDNKVSTSYDIDINGYNALALELEGESNNKAIIWTDGVYYYYIHSTLLDFDELTRVAASVE